jgi:CRISPR system Cascade subunit CasE
MYLYRVFLNLRSREARRDIGSPYDMHSSLSRAFADPSSKCDPGSFLWRLEPLQANQPNAVVLVQSHVAAEWARISYRDWFVREPEPPKILSELYTPTKICCGRKFVFRLRANPTVCKEGKRLGLMRREEYLPWLDRKGGDNGFNVLEVTSSDDTLVRTKQHAGNNITIFTVLFDGMLEIADPNLFCKCLATGIGRAKSLGAGLLSVAPARIEQSHHSHASV